MKEWKALMQVTPCIGSSTVSFHLYKFNFYLDRASKATVRKFGCDGKWKVKATAHLTETNFTGGDNAKTYLILKVFYYIF